MIQDYLATLGLIFTLGVVFLLGSYIAYVLIENEIRVLFPTDSSDPLYNYTHYPNATETPEDEFLAKLRTTYSTLQTFGIMTQIVFFVVSAYFVSKTRFSPIGIPLFFILYFVGLFSAMIYANFYYNISTLLKDSVSGFLVNSYMDWINVKLPYIMAFFGGALFILAYFKSPFTGRDDSGGGIVVG